MELSERIKAIREDKRIKLSEMATALGIDVSNYAKIEKKGKKLTLERLEEIANAMGVGLHELLGHESNSQAIEVYELQKRVKELEHENEILNQMLGFVKQMMDFAKGNPQQIAQLENDLFDGDDKKKERIRKKVIGGIENHNKDTK